MPSHYPISYQWLPVFDKHRYRPLPVSVDFLQNIFDLVFLLVFVWYWNWSPLLIILYYVIETVVNSFFTSLKWWKSDAMLATPTVKAFSIASCCLVISILCYSQLFLIHDALGVTMALPSWAEIRLDEQQFMIGIVAILLQQGMEYYKYQLQVNIIKVEFITSVGTPMLRIFVQQFAVLYGIFMVIIFSFDDTQASSVTIVLMAGIFKLVFGQLQLVVKK
jgi:Family of unknown function (DUF6498)